MSDPNATTRLKLGDALRGLPPASPDRDGWLRLAAQLASARSPRRSRRAWPVALAAAIVLGVLGAFAVHALRTHSGLAPHAIATNPPARASIPVNGEEQSDATTTTSSNPNQLDALRMRSQSLERWLRQTAKSGSPLQGQDLAAATEIENLIGLVDVELSATASSHATALWQRRVGLLEDLAVLRYSNYQLAAGGKQLAANDRID
ncbi:MAG TPA: hypothetical protein VFN13_09675 [Rudaea sp.]|nr:hypothetical protein [Rudaea sp.]